MCQIGRNIISAKFAVAAVNRKSTLLINSVYSVAELILYNLLDGLLC